MPPERCFIWVVTCFLFISVIAGGALLVLYLIYPETPSTSWYPVVGISLICLPWLFWFITFTYRLLSRKLGFRMVCWGAGPNDGQNGGSFATREVTGEAPSMNQGQSGGSVGEEEPGKDQSSSRGSNESEMPLKLSMQS